MIRNAKARALGLALVLAGAAAGGASAQNTVDPIVVTAHRADGGEVRSTRVSYADLDIGTQSGATVLADRIGVAAAEVCGGQPPWYARLDDRDGFAQCRSESMRNAVRSVHSFWLGRVTHGGRAPDLPR